MNKTGIVWKNPQEGWKLDYTFNPITGCLRGCEYCYARKMAKRFYKGDFNPKLHIKRLNDPHLKGKPSTIFVGSMADMFGNWVNKEWIERVLKKLAFYPQHRYMFLTKSPENYIKYKSYLITLDNFWLGATITGEELRYRFDVDRVLEMEKIGCFGGKTFLSIEPLMGEIPPISKAVKLVIVGAMTGRGAVKPKKEWIKSIKHNNIFWKPSMKKYLT